LKVHPTVKPVALVAAASLTRIGSLPEVPTVAQSGYENYEVDQWYGLFAPAKTPSETISQLATWFTAALQAPKVRATLTLQGLDPVGMCGADFAAFLRKQYDDYVRSIRGGARTRPSSGCPLARPSAPRWSPPTHVAYRP
jgi:tripartite-type tricarboxylate transporter receptor subunit TctC